MRVGSHAARTTLNGQSRASGIVPARLPSVMIPTPFLGSLGAHRSRIKRAAPASSSQDQHRRTRRRKKTASPDSPKKLPQVHAVKSLKTAVWIRAPWRQRTAIEGASRETMREWNLRLKNHAGKINAGIFAKRGGEAANFTVPGGAIQNAGL